MNKFSIERRAQLLACLVEGNSMRSTSRMTGACMSAVQKFVADIGRVCAEYQDRVFVNLKSKRIQCDEIWSFVGAKAKNASAEKKAEGWGDAWTWVAIDTETKLVPCWLVGPRNAETASEFIHDLKSRLTNRVQLTTDGNRAYIDAVDNAFLTDVDFAQLVKLYGAPTGGESRYSPAACIGIRKNTMTGQPDEKHISTSFIERQNLTMRMNMRRFTRLTNGHSKKLENHCAAIALFYMHYNFCMIPAIKLARREGIQVILVNIAQRKLTDELVEDADLIRQLIPTA